MMGPLGIFAWFWANMQLTRLCAGLWGGSGQRHQYRNGATQVLGKGVVVGCSGRILCVHSLALRGRPPIDWYCVFFILCVVFKALFKCGFQTSF